MELKIKVIEKKKETHFNGYQRVEKIILKKQTPKKLKKKRSLYEATALMIDDKVKSGTFE